MQNKIWIGNDVVDLNDPLIQGKYNNPRFIARICAKDEQHLLAISTSPHQMLWMFWAIKEATFKALQKHSPSMRFIPNRYQCTSHDMVTWHCNHAAMSCEVHVCATYEFVHAVAVYGGNDGAWKSVVSKVDVLEADSNASDAVRSLALKLLAERGFVECTIKRLNQNERLLPPQIFQGGHPLNNCDVSLSHDGRFIAASLQICRLGCSPCVTMNDGSKDCI